MITQENNYAFIDSQNLYLGVKNDLGWKIDYGKFRRYLKEKYGVTTTYLFIGFIPTNQTMYSDLQKKGYVLIFKPTLTDKGGHTKGNVDADLVLQAMIDFPHYDKAVIISSDGDFYCLVKYLYEQNKLRMVLRACQKITFPISSHLRAICASKNLHNSSAILQILLRRI